MIEFVLACITLIFAAAAAAFSFLIFLRNRQSASAGASAREEIGQLLRVEGDTTRRSTEEQSRATRQELADSLKSFQDSTLNAFRMLSEFINTQIRDFSGRLDSGTKLIDEKVGGLGIKLTQDLAQMESEAHKNRDALRQIVESKLEDTVAKQSIRSKELGDQLEQDSTKLGALVADTLRQSSDHQKERLEALWPAPGLDDTRLS